MQPGLTMFPFRGGNHLSCIPAAGLAPEEGVQVQAVQTQVVEELQTGWPIPMSKRPMGRGKRSEVSRGNGWFARRIAALILSVDRS